MMTAAAQTPALSGKFELRLLGPADPAWASALALVLGGHRVVSDAIREQIAHLVSLSERQKLRLGPLVGAYSGLSLESASLAIESPGRTALVYTPPHHLSTSESSALGDALTAVGRHLRVRGVTLVQGLLPPEDRQRPPIFTASGYRFLAELIYMERGLAEKAPKFMAPRRLRFVTYGGGRRGLFLEALEASYRQSLDCPGLTGLRRSVDVLAGHMATGEYEPEGWFLAMMDGVPAGVLLTARTPNRRMLEIVYMGVAVEARGRGVGNGLMQRALAYAGTRGVDVVTLAVDSINEPARRLYARWGFHETARRRAWIRALASSGGACE